MKWLHVAAISALTVMMMAGCAGGSSDDDPTATAAPDVTAEGATPSTVAATDTPVPKITAVAETRAPDPTATSTVAAEATSTAEPTVPPSPTQASGPVETFGGYELVDTWGASTVPQMPVDVAFSDDGLVVADFGRGEVQVVDESGEIMSSMVVPHPFAEDATAKVVNVATGPDGRIYVAGGSSGQIHLLNSDGDTSAQLSLEEAGSSDTTPNLYDIAVGPDGRVYATASQGGSSSGPLSEPLYGIYVLDAELNLLEEWEAPRSNIPTAIAFDQTGMLYVASYNAGPSSNDGPPPEEPDRLVMIDPDQYTDEVWTGEPVLEQPGDIDGLDVGPSGNLYLVDEMDRRDDDGAVTHVSVLTPNGASLNEWDVPNQQQGGPVSSSGFAVSPDGVVHLADGLHNRVLQFTQEGDLVDEIIWVKPGSLGVPGGLATGPDGNVYVSDAVLDRVQIFDPEGNPAGVLDYSDESFNRMIPVELDVAVGADGRTYVAYPGNPGLVIPFSAGGEKLDSWTKELERQSGNRPRIFQPFSVAVGSGGQIHLVMEMQSFVDTYTPEGELVEQWPEDSGQHGITRGVATDGETVYGLVTNGSREQALLVIRPIGDPEKESIVEFALRPGEEIPGVISDAEPYDLAVDPAGNFLVTSIEPRQVLKFGPDGEPLARWTIEAGNPESRLPLYVAAGDDGRVYVSDRDTERVLVYEPAE